MKAVVHKEITRSGDMCVASTDGRVHMHQPMHTNDMWPHADDCSTGTWNTHLPLPSLTSIFFCFQVGMSQETNWFTTLLVPVLVIVHPFIFPHPSLGSCLPQKMGMGAQSGERGISAQRFTSEVLNAWECALAQGKCLGGNRNCVNWDCSTQQLQPQSREDSPREGEVRRGDRREGSRYFSHIWSASKVYDINSSHAVVTCRRHQTPGSGSRDEGIVFTLVFFAPCPGEFLSSTWYNLELFGKREPQTKNGLDLIDLWVCLEVISLIAI